MLIKVLQNILYAEPLQLIHGNHWCYKMLDKLHNTDM
jgi:hypothetical protein